MWWFNLPEDDDEEEEEEATCDLKWFLSVFLSFEFRDDEEDEDDEYLDGEEEEEETLRPSISG